MFSGAYLYILLCADGSYYVGTARQGSSAASPSTTPVISAAIRRGGVR